jgi:hypothetical protein
MTAVMIRQTGIDGGVEIDIFVDVNNESGLAI